MQRILDVTLSILAIVVLLPLLAPIALALRLSGEGEIFYRQSRIGRGGKTFALLKFATMLKNSPNMGTGTVTVKNDPRILPMGHFLRKTKINELPQLLNILRGEMSIIGPRPQTRGGFEAFPEELKHYVLQVRPGLSGIGSIVFRDEEEMLHNLDDPVAMHRTHLMPYKGQLERWYVQRNGVTIYLKLIVLTAWTVLFPKSGYVWKAFPDLPEPPGVLREMLNYPGTA